MFVRPAAALLALLAAGPARAEPALDMKADKAFQSKTYYQASGRGNCAATSACSVYFPKVDKDGVIIRQASCIVTHKAPIFLAGLGVADKKGDTGLDPSVTLQVPPSVAVDAVRYSQINQTVLFRVPGGKLPAVVVLTNEGVGVDLYCTISGEPG